MTHPTPQSAGTPEMVERVARALFDLDFEGVPRARWEDASDQSPWIRAARSAIAAMREPTEAMVNAGDAGIDSDCRYECDPEEVWRAMIESALSTQGGDGK